MKNKKIMKNKKLFKAKAILLMFILVLVLTVLSCRKEKPTYYMPQEFKDYVMFPVGSYWIYKDSISGAIDSISLTKQLVDIISDDRIYCTCDFELLIQEYYSTYIDSIIYRFGEPNFNKADAEHYIHYIGRSMFTSSVDFNYYKILYYPFIEATSQYFVYSYKESIIINSNKYSNIRVFANSISNNEYSENYFCKNIGIIKRKIITLDNDTIVWELKKYHINN